MPHFLSLFQNGFFLSIIIFSFPLVCHSASEDVPVVLTSSGPVKGELVRSGTVTAYLGIPYAEPPVGKQRFQKPLPRKPWTQILEATRFGNSCPQLMMSGLPDAALYAANTPLSEDCLFLNIWVPHPQPTRPVPVLVWIYGGGFFTGTASLDIYNGASLAASQDVIVFSLNYRLGILGFCFLPPAAPGNVALLDQQLALQWINNNAAAFGGDPKLVTLFGQSAGAASVSLHLLSPSSQHLFSKAVIQSGSANAIWSWETPEESKQRAITFGQQLGCNQSDPSAVVSCLQTKEAKEFRTVEASVLQTSKYLVELPVMPTTDGDFLPDDPQKLLEEKSFQVKPVIIGVTSDEGSVLVVYPFLGTDDSHLTREEMLKGIRRVVRNATEEAVQDLALKYTEESHGPRRYYRALSQIAGDYFFVCPVAEFAGILAEAGSPVYAYIFAHHTSGSFWPEWTGAFHGVEVPYVFGTLESAVAVNQSYTKAEAALSRRLMEYWAQFSRSGKPTGSDPTEVEWPIFNTSQQNFFQLNIGSPQVLQKSPVRHCASFKTQSWKAAKPTHTGVEDDDPKTIQRDNIEVTKPALNTDIHQKHGEL